MLNIGLPLFSQARCFEMQGVTEEVAKKALELAAAAKAAFQDNIRFC